MYKRQIQPRAQHGVGFVQPAKGKISHTQLVVRVGQGLGLNGQQPFIDRDRLAQTPGVVIGAAQPLPGGQQRRVGGARQVKVEDGVVVASGLVGGQPLI